MMKGILIDVYNRTVTEVEFRNSLKSYYQLLHCDCITTALFDDHHDLILDDESLLKNPIAGFFKIPGIGEFAGNALIVYTTKGGNWKSHKLNFEEVKNSVRFIQYIKEDGKLKEIFLPTMNPES